MKSKKRTSGVASEAAESRFLVQHAFELARELKIGKVLVLAHLLQDRKTVEKHRQDEVLIWVARGAGSCKAFGSEGHDHCVEIPETNIGRIDQVKLGLIMAGLRKEIAPNESVLCLTGLAGSKRLDNLLITNLERDYPWFRSRDIAGVDTLLASREFARLIEIAVKFSTEGREGKSIGTTFVLGNIDEVEKHARQLILNPLKGHPKRSRSIHNPDFIETIRELAALDGAFLIDRKGNIARAATYLDAPLTQKVKVTRGLGARHTAAAAISAKANCLGIVISESSGTVSVFSKGLLVLEMERTNN